MAALNKFYFILFFNFAVPASFLVASENQKIIVGDFSSHANSLPKSWNKLTFPTIEEHTSYTLVNDENINVVKAQSNESASGLTNKIRFNPKEYPYLSWRWKVKKAIPGTDVTSKSGDDYAARVYVIFDYDFDDLPKEEKSKVSWYKLFNGKLPPLATLNYIWGNKMSIGHIVPSPYTKRVKMITLRNKKSALDQWHSEERNIYEDYKNAFGEEPKDVISVAIMTDTDNTKSMALSYFGDISVSQKPMFVNNATGQMSSVFNK